jgi:LPS O-antigen subunit length determinant protein (WzzB/FepE family)
MKLVTVLAAVLLSGCAGLNVSFVATATYNTPATTTATMTPGAK